MSELSKQDAQLEEYASAQLSPGVEVSGVEVQVEKLDNRQRRISASIKIPLPS